MNDQSIFSRLLTIVMLTAIPIGLLGFLLLMRSEFAEFRDLRSLVDRSIETRASLTNLLAEHLDVETGQRGYVLTRNEEFLQPYATARFKIARTFDLLEEHARTAHDLSQGITRLRELSRGKLAFADATVELAKRGDIDAARRMVTEGQGKRLMDAIRAEVVRLDRSERARLDAVTASRDQARARLERTIYFLVAAFSLLLAWVAIVTARAIRERQREFARANALRERLRAILNGAVDGVLLLDSDGNIRGTNPSIERLFGFDEAHLIGRHNTFLMADPPSMEDSTAWLRSVGSAGLQGAGRQEEFTGRRKDGSTFETAVAISRFADDGDSRYIATIRDVTERKRAEEMKTEFVSTVSHELRTPLTSIGGSLGLLAAGAVGPLNEKAARLVQIAHSNCERLIRLINDILDIEKIESGKMHFDMRRMRLAPLIDAVVAGTSQFAADRNVRLEAHHPDWPLMVEGDIDRLEQLLTNLVSNAVKHSPADELVQLFVEQRRDRVRIEVCDRGAGVPQDFRGRIFGKFAMADGSDSRARGGTGLGLSIAREIAERHGGTVDFLDRPGGGTVFFVELPLICEDQAERATADQGAPKVLHLDDDQDCLDVVASAFEGRAAVISAATIGEAERALEVGSFAAVVIDIGLAPGNGLELVPTVRNIDPRVPVVLFTAFDEPKSNKDVDTVLVKSRNSIEDLVEVTMRLIAERAENAG